MNGFDNRIGEGHEHARKQRRSWLFAMACIGLVLWCVLFNTPRIGVADNGDFIRFNLGLGLEGYSSYPEADHPYYTVLTEKWDWEAFDWAMLTPFMPSFGVTWPVSLIRGITNLLSDTAVTPFHTAYLAVVYAVALLIAIGIFVKHAIRLLENYAPWFILLGVVVFLGSMHLAYFNSLYGEALLFTGLFLSLALLLETITAKTWKRSVVLLALHLFVSFLFLIAKPQGVLAYPFWAVVQGYLCFYLWKKFGKELKPVCKAVLPVMMAFYLVWTGASCYRLYSDNNVRCEPDTLYSAVFNGALRLTETEEEGRQMLEDMGLDPELIQDKGKHPYLSRDQYFMAPRTEQAQEMFYSKINTFGVLGYYLTHPQYLYQILDVTAQYAVTPNTTLVQFQGEQHGSNVAENGRFTLWENVRKYVTPQRFWQYFVIYALLVFCAIRNLVVHRNDRRQVLLTLLYLLIMVTGVIQYPLPFIGNGYSDTTKQLYLFMLCWDITMFWNLMIAVLWLRRRYGTATGKEEKI